jgi:hypothetical protein
VIAPKHQSVDPPDIEAAILKANREEAGESYISEMA